MGTRPSEVYTIIAATGAKHGNYKTYTREGYVMLDCNFSNNELNGSYKEFFGENNSTQVKVSGNYVKGKKNGEWREWDQAGPGEYFLRWVTKYNNDEKLEQTRYYSAGKKWNYYLKDGVCTNWFDDGSKEEEWTNQNGRKNGVATTWAKDHKGNYYLLKKETYVDNLKHGPATTYHPNGQISVEETYANNAL